MIIFKLGVWVLWFYFYVCKVGLFIFGWKYEGNGWIKVCCLKFWNSEMIINESSCWWWKWCE